MEHDRFIPKDIWRIFDSKVLVDFLYLQWQIYCLTRDTVKQVQRINNNIFNWFPQLSFPFASQSFFPFIDIHLSFSIPFISYHSFLSNSSSTFLIYLPPYLIFCHLFVFKLSSFPSSSHLLSLTNPEADFLDVIGTKVLRVLLAIHSHLYFTPWSKIDLQLVCNVNIVYRNLKSANSQECAQKPQRNCTFMNSASVSSCRPVFWSAETLCEGGGRCSEGLHSS